CRPGWRLPPQQQQETFDEALGSDDRDGNTGDNGLSVVGAGRRTCATAPHRRTVAASAKRDGSVSPRNRCPRHARRDHAGRSAAPPSMARMATRATGGRTRARASAAVRACCCNAAGLRGAATSLLLALPVLLPGALLRAMGRVG